MRQFVGKGVNREGMIDVGHAAQPSDAHVEIGGAVFGAMVRNIEGKIVPSEAHLVERIGGGGVERRTDGRIDGALQPRRGLAIRPDRSLHVHGGHGVKEIEVNIVFAAPDDFHGLAQLLGQNGRFRHLVGLGLASEAAAEQRDMARHVFFLDAEHAGNRFLHSLRILRGGPG